MNIGSLIVIAASCVSLTTSGIIFVSLWKMNKQFWEDHPRRWITSRNPFKRYNVTIWRGREIVHEYTRQNKTLVHITGSVWLRSNMYQVVVTDRHGNCIEEITNA